jgi:hypothetical protein
LASITLPISLAINALVHHLVITFTPLLTDNLAFFVTRFPLYRQSILNAHITNGNEVRKLRESAVGNYYLIGVLIANTNTCLNGGGTHLVYFNCPPPTLAQYFNCPEVAGF